MSEGLRNVIGGCWAHFNLGTAGVYGRSGAVSPEIFNVKVIFNFSLEYYFAPWVC